MSAYIDFNAECLTLPGIQSALDLRELNGTRLVFRAKKIARDGRSTEKVEGAISKGDRNGSVRYILAFTSTATNNTAINNYDDVAEANAVMSRARLLWDFSEDEEDSASPGVGDWDMVEIRSKIVASGRKQLTGGANGSLVFDEQTCKEALWG